MMRDDCDIRKGGRVTEMLNLKVFFAAVHLHTDLTVTSAVKHLGRLVLDGHKGGQDGGQRTFELKQPLYST